MTEEISTGGSDHRVTVIKGAPTVGPAGDVIANHIQQATTAQLTITHSRSLGVGGPTVAQTIAAHCENDYTALQRIFGGITPASLPFQIRLTPGATGASHATCLATQLMIGVRSAPAGDPEFVNGLVAAAEDEVFMATLGHGWNCVFSNGEGLSRVLSNELYPCTEPSGFVSAPVWLDSGRHDFVSTTEATDRDYVSIDCSVLFLNWLHTALGHSHRDTASAEAFFEQALGRSGQAPTRSLATTTSRTSRPSREWYQPPCTCGAGYTVPTEYRPSPSSAVTCERGIACAPRVG